MENSEDKILLDNLLTRRNEQRIARFAIIGALVTIVVVTISIFAFSIIKINQAKSVDVVFDTQGNSYKAQQIDKSYLRNIKFNVAVARGFTYAYTYNDQEGVYEENMEKARHFFDRNSINSILAEHKASGRLSNIKVHNLDYWVQIDPKEDISIDFSSKPYKGELKAVQIMQFGQAEVHIEITANFNVYMYKSTSSWENPEGIKIYNWKWSERDITNETSN